MRDRWWLVLGVISSVMLRAIVEAKELHDLTTQLLPTPIIQAEVGFTARMFVPPGHVYNPRFMVPHDAGVWVSDERRDGQGASSRLLAIDAQGRVSVLAEGGGLLSMTGFAVAPLGFGAYGGQLFTLALGKAAMVGATANGVVQRVDPIQGYTASVFCTLPENGVAKVSGFGAEAHFGPQGSAFTDKLYVVHTATNAIYQVTPDGQCSPFVTFDARLVGVPFGFTFAADGNSMLVTVARDDALNPTQRVGMIVRVLPNGRVDDRPVARGLTAPMGLAVAPATFGIYASDIFVADVGRIETPESMTPALDADGRVYRVTRLGELYTVARGFVNPTSMCFIGNSLWVSDTNGKFSAGKRDLPNGFVVTITDR